MLGVWPAVFRLWKNFRQLDQGSEPSSIKSPIVSILSFVGHMLSAVATQSCCHSTEAAMYNMQMRGQGLFLLGLYLQNITSQVWPTCCRLLSPG